MTTSSSPGHVLVLGGTTEARELAAALTEAGIPVVSSLAGRLRAPRRPDGDVRVGGFGGPEAMAAWLVEQAIVAVVDATHPFATAIGEATVAACRQAGLPLLRLERPAWAPQPGDCWHRVADLDAAAQLLPELGTRALLAIGRQGVSAFARVDSVWFLIRCIEPPADPLPPHYELLLARGPFAVEDEQRLLAEHAIDVVITKNSGGTAVDAKLEAARRLGLPVVMIDRPARPPGPHTVHDVPSALAWVASLGGRADESACVAASDSTASRNR